MRLIGKGSAASAVRVLLSIFNVVLAASTVVLLLTAVAAWLIPDFGAGFIDGYGSVSGKGVGAVASPGGLPALLTVAGLSSGLVWFIVNRLRRIFGTLTAGDPFQPENVRWLRQIGLALIGVQAARIMTPMLVWDDAARAALNVEAASIDLSDWLGVLIVFILAEVFREGARMRDEQAHLV